MRYCVDRIENDIAVLENLTTGEIINVSKKELPDIHEGSILIVKNYKYVLDIASETKRRQDLRERFENLKK